MIELGNEKVVIDDAIRHSREHDTIATIDFDPMDDGIRAAIEYIEANYNGNVDHARRGYGDDTCEDVTEVWGYTDDMPEGEMEFRVHFRHVPGLASDA